MKYFQLKTLLIAWKMPQKMRKLDPDAQIIGILLCYCYLAPVLGTSL